METGAEKQLCYAYCKPQEPCICSSKVTEQLILKIPQNVSLHWLALPYLHKQLKKPRKYTEESTIIFLNYYFRHYKLDLICSLLALLALYVHNDCTFELLDCSERLAAKSCISAKSGVSQMDILSSHYFRH